ncbi:MAG: hypothetical protein SNG02_05565 [Rikenellaceae bacterium]
MPSSRSNVGAVFSVVMWLAKDSGRDNPPTSLDSGTKSVRIPIVSAQSQYSEVVTINSGITNVEHTLTLTTCSSDEFWDVGPLDEASRVGCIAEVDVSAAGSILLGWSSHLGYDQPLRLTKVTSQGSDSVNQRCTKSWVFKSYSTRALI